MRTLKIGDRVKFKRCLNLPNRFQIHVFPEMTLMSGKQATIADITSYSPNHFMVNEDGKRFIYTADMLLNNFNYGK